MSDIDNIEDMLAELEGSSGGRHDSYGDYDSGVDNIDDFLDQIEEEARSSKSYAGRSAANSVANRPPAQSKGGFSNNANAGYGNSQTPVNRAPQQSVSKPVQAKPPAQSQARPPAQSQARPPAQSQSRPPAQSQSRPPQGGGGGGGAARGGPAVGGKDADQLRAEGFEVHLNKGKFYNYSGGKASDFRIKGTTSTRVDLPHTITLRSLDDYGNPAKIDNHKDFIGCALTHRQTGDELQCWIKDNGDCTYDLAFVSKRAGTVRMEIKLCGNPMFDIDIQVEDLGRSLWVAKPRLPAKPMEVFFIDIETSDGSRPEGVAPFEVQTMGDVEGLKLINNGDGTYKFQCIPQHPGHITIQITLHGQPIKDSPVTVPVGEGRQPLRVKQESSHVETLKDDRHNTGNDYYEDLGEPYEEEYAGDVGYDQGYDQGYDDGGGEEYYDDGGHAGGGYDDYGQRDSTDVSNDDLNRLLDELGG